MAEQLNPNDLITLEDLAISNMWETTKVGKRVTGPQF